MVVNRTTLFTFSAPNDIPYNLLKCFTTTLNHPVYGIKSLVSYTYQLYIDYYLSTTHILCRKKNITARKIKQQET